MRTPDSDAEILITACQLIGCSDGGKTKSSRVIYSHVLTPERIFQFCTFRAKCLKKIKRTEEQIYLNLPHEARNQGETCYD